MTRGDSWSLFRHRLSEQPMGHSLEVAVSELTAGGENLLEDRASPRRFLLEQVAVSQPDAESGPSQAEI